MIKVKWNKLLLLASLVWGAAGINILKIGAEAYASNTLPLNFLLSLLVFTIFHALIFNKLVRKHTTRIEGYTEELQFFLKFFDLKSFAIMAVMMTGGIGLRVNGAVPERFIAVFYTGLGSALLLAGLMFGRNFLKTTNLCNP
ncbi:MAG: hypothetical protein Q3982_09485 [Phoenicibacter congonensis]|uniref:Uncharacterized protein n=1 Tax=Phoenicibacter congonensis TaxID=1944646 RepID=A0AA43UBM3_9ACTN|nr:hypothetical protein [Phoenicibacter congonensis]